MHSSDTMPASAGILLSEAESRTRLGKYNDALDILEHTVCIATGEHSEHWTGMVCAAAARNKLHAQDEQGALQYLGMISPGLRAANPKIDAECHTIRGILLRREAYDDWKTQRKGAALLTVQQAIDAFESAQHSAQMALEDRLQHNAVLNRLYATGLRLAILGQPQEHFAALLADAIVAEAASRDATPLCMRDDLTGLTIIVDLARGGGIPLPAVRSLSGEQAFQAATGKIIRYDSASWAELIMDYVRDMNFCKTEVLARALLLGCNMLHAGRHELADDGLQLEYAARLRIACLDLNSTAFNALLRRRILDAIARFPQEIACMVMHPRFFR